MWEIADNSFVQVYISKPSDYPHSPSKLLLMLSSGKGIHSPNNQLQADKYAGEGFLVVMPDQYVFLKSKMEITLIRLFPDLQGTQYPISKSMLMQKPKNLL